MLFVSSACGSVPLKDNLTAITATGGAPDRRENLAAAYSTGGRLLLVRLPLLLVVVRLPS
jgi:hypothetical protein